MNIAKTKGLTAAQVTAAQKLSDELANSKNMLVPLDKFLNAPR
jgi:hypothetical protein